MNQLEINTTSFQKSILSQLNKKLEIEMTSIEDLSLAIARNDALHTFMKGIDDTYKRNQTVTNMTNSIENITFSEPIIDSITIYLENPPSYGQQVSIQYDRLKDMQTLAWYQKVKNSDFSWIGEHKILTNHGKVSVISFVRKLYNSVGVTQGFLVINLKSDDFKKMFQGEGIVSNVLLLDSGGYLIVGAGDPDFIRKANVYLNQIDTLGDQKEQNENGVTRSNDQLVVWNRSFQSGWILIEVTPLRKLADGSFRMAVIFTGFGLIAIIVSLLFTLYISKQFTRPIFELIKNMKDIPREFGENRLPEDYQNEFGALFQGYKHMVNRILELYHSLDNQYQKQREAEIKALQSMINPHFLYNTLDQLNWMAIAAGEERMSMVLELMGKMFRIGLSNGESLITIREELLHLECYMKIQQIRLGEGITYQFDVPSEVQEFYIPKLTLQPFVENSILHGFHDRHEGHSLIRISEDKDFLHVQIADNGIGLRADNRNDNKQLGGYGIRNVSERLKAYFGSSFGIQMESLENMGTVVSFRLPKITDKQNFGGLQYVENSNH
ncbi:sensor histidine kinase [Fodinisporobacter ferrooxydans]|uniref:Sensor histidine kinase n=1 Tax=Fodinisporobacter ferrooxydans TaxID=2901836 RepID=A0ABY4CJ76_9BACL|nr:sensor histidine kinase [Alicyclobacillaceae bacterium MYW30-H2]